MAEPGQPGYDPTTGSSGSSTGGDAAASVELGGDLYEIYRAGAVLMPGIATRIHEQAVAIQHNGGRVESLRGQCDGSTIDVLDRLQTLHDLLFSSINHTSIACQDTGTALVTVAADLAERDETAAAEFSSLMQGNDHLFDTTYPPVAPVVPPADDAPPTGSPQHGPVVA